MLINEVADFVRTAGELDVDTLRLAKEHGFSDAQIAQLRRDTEPAVREIRHALGLRPVYKTVDTCAGEFPALTPYHYSSYDFETEVAPSDRTQGRHHRLRTEPHRPGRRVRLLVRARVVRTVGRRVRDRHGQLQPRDRLDRLRHERPAVLRAAHARGRARGAARRSAVGRDPRRRSASSAGRPRSVSRRAFRTPAYRILGTSPEAIDLAEERQLFSDILDAAGLIAPRHGTAVDPAGAVVVAEDIGYPVLVRPSFVLGGRGMEIIYDTASLRDYFVRTAGEVIVAPGMPLLVDRFLDDAVEIDVDALYDGTELYIGGVMEHIEEAGIHSGDSACTLPPVSLGRSEIDRVREATLAIAEGVGVRGLLNVQFAISAGVLYVIEANPRASRTVPFVSKALGIPLAKAAARIMVGASVDELRSEGLLPVIDGSRVPLDSPVSVKEAVLPFKRFRTKDGQTVDSVLGPEMRSTGEVMGIDRDFPRAFAKSQEAAYGGMPLSGTVFISVADSDKRAVILPAHRLQELGFTLVATEGTAEILARNGIAVEVVNKYSETQESGERNIVDLINAGEIDIVVNTPSGRSARADGYEIRAAAVTADKALFTTIAVLGAAVSAMDAVRAGYDVKSLQEYAADRAARL